MSITSGFFNSVDGDRLYNARDMSMYFKGLISDGVYESVGGKMQVTAGGDMSVNVAEGRAIIDCQWVNIDAAETLTIDAPDVGKIRKDAIVLRLDMNESARSITLLVKKGTATTGTAALPARTWTDSVKELYLAYVTVSGTTTAISQSVITDLRGTAHCPYVTGLIKQVDTAELFDQYQTAMQEMLLDMTDWCNKRKQEFDAWYAGLTEELKVDVTLTKYQYVYTINEDLYSVPLIEQYEEGDILFAHINGVWLIESKDFTIIDGAVRLAQAARAGDTITQELIKSSTSGGGSSSGSVIASQVDYLYNTENYLVDGTNITLYNQADGGADVTMNFIGADLDAANNRVYVDGNATSYGSMDYTPSEGDTTAEYTLYLVTQGAAASCNRFLSTSGDGYSGAGDNYNSACIWGETVYRVSNKVNGEIINSEVLPNEKAVIAVRRNDQGILTAWVNGAEIGELETSYNITAGKFYFGITTPSYTDGLGYYFHEFGFSEKAHDSAAILENCAALMERYGIS